MLNTQFSGPSKHSSSLRSSVVAMGSPKSLKSFETFLFLLSKGQTNILEHNAVFKWCTRYPAHTLLWTKFYCVIILSLTLHWADLSGYFLSP